LLDCLATQQDDTIRYHASDMILHIHSDVNVGFVDVRFMCGNGKGFNVAGGIHQFIAVDRAIDKDFCLLPLGGQDKNICIPADFPNLEGRHTKILPS
jgi:hypothetical protein